MSRSGKFFVLDGPDGGGKTTQISLLQDALISMGREVVMTRAPGGTQTGEKIRGIILDPSNTQISIRTELFLYMACRAQLVEELIAPSIERGDIVLCDRFLSSSVVYQGAAGKLGVEAVQQIGDFCIRGNEPDLTIILDVNLETGAARRSHRSADRIELRDKEYQEKVREGFLSLAASDPKRFKIVNSSRSIDEIHLEILELVKHAL